MLPEKDIYVVTKCRFKKTLIVMLIGQNQQANEISVVFFNFSVFLSTLSVVIAVKLELSEIECQNNVENLIITYNYDD